MKKEELSANLAKMKTALTELKKKRFLYFIHGKYIERFGALQLIDDTQILVEAFAFVKSKFELKDLSLADELNITIKEKESEDLYLGYTLEEWTTEFKMRAKEIQNDDAIIQLEKAIKKFKSYRTEDDKFAEDVNKFSNLFTELGINNSTSQAWETVETSTKEIENNK